MVSSALQVDSFADSWFTSTVHSFLLVLHICNLIITLRETIDRTSLIFGHAVFEVVQLGSLLQRFNDAVITFIWQEKSHFPFLMKVIRSQHHWNVAIKILA